MATNAELVGVPCPNSSLAESGLIIGMYDRKTDLVRSHGQEVRRLNPGELVRYGGDSHLMTFGVTGSGKTTGPVISNALDHEGPLISIECKGDVYDATASHRRRRGHRVAVLDLRSLERLREGFNPIDAYRMLGDDVTVTARSIAADLIDREAREGIFWLNWAETLLTGVMILSMAASGTEDQTFGNAFNRLHGDDVNHSFALLLDTYGEGMNPTAYSIIANYLQLPERETRPSVLASAQQYLRLWEAEPIRRITDRTTFDLAGLVAGAPVSLYIIVPAFRMKAYAPLLRVWLSSLLGALMTRRPRPDGGRTLVLCDELGALGRIDSFVTASTLLRSANVQLWSFWQNPAQLEIYGADARTLVDNAGVLQLLGAKNHRMAREFADLVGGISPDEIMALAPEEQLVLTDGGRPRKLRKVRSFEHPVFRDAIQSAL